MGDLEARKIRVFIVDDVPETTESLARLIALEPDMEVVGRAADGLVAVFAAPRSHPDVVLMDILMPVMDGITATARLTKIPGWTAAVVMMSVQGEQDYLRRALDAGAVEYLVKPFTADELVAAIRDGYSFQQRARQTGAASPTADGPRTSAGPSDVPATEQTEVVDLMAALKAAVEKAKASETLDEGGREGEALPVGPVDHRTPLARDAASSGRTPPDQQAVNEQEIADSTATSEAQTPQWRLVTSLAWLVGLAFFVLVLTGVIQAYGSGPGILRGFVGGVISFFAELTGGALLMWLGFAGVGSVIGLAFSLIGAARGRRRWFVPPLFTLAAIAVTPARQLVQGTLDWLGGVSHWNDAAYWGAAAGVLFLLAVTTPAFVRDLWRWCNGATFAELTRRGIPLSFAWLAVPFLAVEQGSGLLGWLPVLAVIAVITAVCGRG